MYSGVVLPRRRLFRASVVVVVLLAASMVWPFVRRAMRPKPPRPDAVTLAQAKRVRIVRDTWGVPHVFGKTDADAAFGLAYANAEDDWATVQSVMAAAIGRLGLLQPSKTALANDYYVALVRVREQLDEGYDALPADYRAVLEAYARGLNLYAYLHPDEADGRLFPLRGRDIAAGFVHKIPLVIDLQAVLGELDSGPPKRAGDRILATEAERPRSTMPGSNAHAVAARRSTDGTTRLNVNSHQPWEGPVTWYEAHVVSEEGWNMTGGLFPGAPVVLHGHNEHLGWAHTVNTPDLIDVYEVPPGMKVEEKQAALTIDTGFFELTLHKAVYFAPDLGPVFATGSPERRYAIRYAGMGRAIRAGEQWFRMNKARSLEEWKSAMRIQAIPLFNTVYADRENVFYVYNALLPKRAGPWDYRTVLPGDAPEAVWTEYVPFDALPQVENPASGFVQTCNSTPFATTLGPENPRPGDFAPNAGIETAGTNRAARSVALLGAPGPIDRARFLAMKWDRAYAKDAAIFRDVVGPLLAAPAADAREEEALEILRRWDGTADEASTGATIAILTWRRVDPKTAVGAAATGVSPVPLREAFRETVRLLEAKFGTVRVHWGDVQRLRRGPVDLALGGGPDVLNAVLARDAWDGRIVGYQGDSYVLEVEFGPDGTTSRSLQPYGSSVRPGSPHSVDQAGRYTSHQLKPTLRDPAELAKHTERSYHPGE
jgi:penicillin amidase/acyl-homoserine-lactone acylase